MSESTLPARLADARARRARWCHEARVLGQIAFEADASRTPLSAPASGRASALLTAAWERRAGLWHFDASAIGPLPDWADCPRERRHELAVLAGAVLCARALRQCIDGSVLKRVADVIGEERLDVLTRLCVGRAAALAVTWEADPVGQLHALGGEVLLRSASAPVAMRRRLAMLFPRSNALGEVEPALLARVADDARMLWAGRQRDSQGRAA
ncbi:MAG: hypothetical protein WCG13_03550 [Burkholderiales bacterium]|jgi:hypothetical protein